MNGFYPLDGENGLTLSIFFTFLKESFLNYDRFKLIISDLEDK